MSPRKSPLTLFWWIVISLGGFIGFLWLAFPHLSMFLARSAVPLPMPAMAVAMYLLLALLGAFIYVTSDPARRQEFLAPVWGFLLAEGALGRVRLGFFVVAPLLVGGVIFGQVAPRVTSPTGLRIQHPTMPSRFEGIENPLRTPSEARVKQFMEQENLRGVSLEQARAFLVEKWTREGVILYEKNCRPCHGVAAGGDGPMAGALPLKPANFRDPGTIATVVESYAFWRVNEGGRGLPTVATPWDSAMPVWKGDLKEDEMWKILLAEYATAGVEPRKPEKLK
jgi:hypothetical protein